MIQPRTYLEDNLSKFMCKPWLLLFSVVSVLVSLVSASISIHNCSRLKTRIETLEVQIMANSTSSVQDKRRQHIEKNTWTEEVQADDTGAQLIKMMETMNYKLTLIEREMRALTVKIDNLAIREKGTSTTKPYPNMASNYPGNLYPAVQ